MPKRTTTDSWIATRIGIPTEGLMQEQIETWQLTAFIETLKYAKENSSFYKKHLEGVSLDRIKRIEDIAQIPLSSEKDLAGNEHQFLCVAPHKVSRVVTVSTTGTSGHKKRISFTPADVKKSMEFIYTGFQMLCNPGDRMLVMMGGLRPGSIGDVVKRAVAPMQVDVLVYGPIESISEAYACICEYKPNVIVAIPGQVAAVAQYGNRFGNPERKYIQNVLLSADDVPEAICQRLRDLWGCNTFRHYGMTELGLTGGVECYSHDGYHLRDCDVLFEIIDPDENGFGEIVVTTLGREAMPLIRYRTGDIGRFSNVPCSCGSKLRKIEQILGRKRNLIRIGEQKVNLADLENAAFSLPTCIDIDCVVDDNQITLTLKSLPDEFIDEPTLIKKYFPSVPIIIQTAHLGHFSEIHGIKKTVERR